MNKDRELMQQALEALVAGGLSAYATKKAREVAIITLRERLAQPEQEPVAHLWQHSETGRTRIVMPDQIITTDATWHVVGPLHLGTPPRREWVGLTDEDLSVCDEDGVMLARYWERVLREKNNG